MGLYTVAKHWNIDDQTSEAMYAACGIIWRVVADHDRTESEMKRLRNKQTEYRDNREASSRDY
jgi:hypothetical protein